MAQWPYNTAAWQRLRRAKLAEAPFCEPCRQHGRLVVANTVDHVLPVSKGGDPFPPRHGLTSMCAGCHSRKTAQGDRLGAAATRKRRGGGVDPATGKPLDPEHWWNRDGGRQDEGKSLRASPKDRAHTLSQS